MAVASEAAYFIDTVAGWQSNEAEEQPSHDRTWPLSANFSHRSAPVTLR